MVISLTGGNGPAECPAGARVGQINSYPLGVERTPDGVMLILDPHNYPTDHWADYEGSLTDGVVAAQGRYYGGDLCGGMVVNGLTNYGVPAVFAGTLSADGTILTGKETRTTVVDGKTYSYEYDWRAELKQQ